MARKGRKAARAVEGDSFDRLHELLGKPLQLMSMYLRAAERLGMREQWLTTYDEKIHAVLMLSFGEPNSRSKLILSGIHGDEPAGVIGLLSFLFKLIESPGLRRQVGSFALVPMLSPSALELQRRHNLWDEDANRGFRVSGIGSGDSIQTEPSCEGKILVDNLDCLEVWAQNGVLALHEDCDESGFYLYDFSASASPSAMACLLRDCGGKLFGTVIDSDSFEGSVVRDGIILNHLVHGAIDELFFVKMGVPVVVTETPGLRSLASRAEASMRLLELFLTARLKNMSCPCRSGESS